MIRYLITTDSRQPGARLSKPGHWGNQPYDDDASAAEAARRDAGRQPFDICRKHYDYTKRKA